MNRRTFIKRGALFVPMIFIPRLIRAQSAHRLAVTSKKKASGGGGGVGGGFTFIGSVAQAGSSGDTTSPTLDTTGATDLWALVSGNGLSPASITDSKVGNTWNADINWNNNKLSLFHCNPVSVGTGHTVTISTVSGGNVIFFAASKSVGGALDSVSSPGSTGAWNGSTVNAGSLTPATANDIFIALAWSDAGSVASVDSGFTLISCASGNPGLAGAYKIKSSSSTAENPGMVNAANSDGVVIQATYK